MVVVRSLIWLGLACVVQEAFALLTKAKLRHRPGSLEIRQRSEFRLWSQGLSESSKNTTESARSST